MILKGHDKITTEAIQATDAMVFLVDYTVKDVGTAALRKMLSSAKLKDVVNRGDRIIAVMNKADCLRGITEKETSINKFLSLLENANVTKNLDEIRLYSAIAGECRYQGIKIEQTMYGKKKYEEVYTDYLEEKDGLSPEELHEKTLAKLRRKLEESYAVSGIAELKEFFRTTYIKEGKYNHTTAAVFAVRRLLSEIIFPLNTLASNYKTMNGLALDVIEKISGELKRASDTPINDAISEAGKVEVDKSIVETLMDSMPDTYVNMFRTALEEYKRKNLAIITEFDLTYLGLGNQARIDKTDSSNYRIYQRLLKSCMDFSVDVVRVNKKYASVLEYVTKWVERIYKHSLDILMKLKKDFPKKLNEELQIFEQQCVSEPSIVKSIQSFKETLVQYVEIQIGIIQGNMNADQQKLVKAGNDTASEMIDFNDDMIQKYTDSMRDEIYSKVTSGAIFSSREYIRIDGSDGLKGIFSGLQLSEDDRGFIDGEVKNIGNRKINNNLHSWIDDAKASSAKPFLELRAQIMKLIKDTAADLMAMADGNSILYQNTQDTLEKVTEAARFFRDEVQKNLDFVLEETENDILRQYKGNILLDILE